MAQYEYAKIEIKPLLTDTPILYALVDGKYLGVVRCDEGDGIVIVPHRKCFSRVFVDADTSRPA